MPNVELSVGDLLNQLSSPDFFEREEAVKELAQIREDEAVAGLVMALEDEDRGIRELAAENLVKIGGSISSKLLAMFLGREDISVRNLAAEILVKIGSDAVPALAEALENPDHDIRKFALDTLGLIRDKSVNSRIHRMLNDPNENVACSAAEALGLIGGSESVELLLNAFEKYDFLRPQAAEALGRIGDKAAFKGLRKHLNTDDPVVLFSVIEALGHLKHPAGIKTLSPYLDHPEQTIADAATAAVIRTAQGTDRSAYKDLPQDKFKKFLLDSLKSDDHSIVQFALDELYHWDAPDVIEELISLLKKSEDDLLAQIAEVIKSVGESAVDSLADSLNTATDEEKIRILNALAEIGDSGSLPKVAEQADSDNPDIREAAAITLGKCNAREAIGVLKKLGRDSVGHVRSAAIKSIGWLGIEEDVGMLVEYLDDHFPDVREAAMGAMILIGGSKVIQTFTGDLQHESPDRQRLAAIALGMIGEDETREPLIRALSHSDPTVRRSAVESLSRIGNLDDVDEIRLTLSDEDPLVRKTAVSALINLIGSKAVDDIKILLTDDDMWVRYHTIDALGGLGDSRYARLVVPYLSDEQDIVKIAAVKALASLGDQSCLGHLKQLATEANKDLANAVDEATRALMGTDNG